PAIAPWLQSRTRVSRVAEWLGGDNYAKTSTNTREAADSCTSVLLDHGRPARDVVAWRCCRCAVAGARSREHQPVGRLGMALGRCHLRGGNHRRLFCVRTLLGCFAIQT